MKKILFITQQLAVGGVEKALINLLDLLDRERYECTLLVVEDEGGFRDRFPSWLKIIEYDCPTYVKKMANYYRCPSFAPDDSVGVKASKLVWMLIHYLNKVTTKIFKRNTSYRFMYQKYKRKNDFSDYDMIVDFHGYGVYTTYIAAHQKTSAKKVSWVHEETIYSAYDFITGCYKKFDHIFANCIDSKNNFVQKFPKCEGKTSVYYNYLDCENIIKMSKEKLEDNTFKDGIFKIVSVGRANEQKSFDRAIDAADLLKNKNKKFQWIVIGDGEELEGLREQCAKRNLEGCLSFVGYRKNPYPYIANADLYVQTSRAEGYCTAISEAVILGKAVVSTRVGGVDEQLDDGKGGVVVEHTPKALVEAIENFMDNRELLQEKAKHNATKDMRFEKEIEKLYEVIE